jgi:hypothetical protein
VRSRWNRRVLTRPAVRSELTLHAQRMARLNRMLRLATWRNRSALRFRINALIRKENRRHQRRMTALAGRLARR